MIYKFKASITVEGKRSFIKVPFNVWSETSLKGNIPCKVSIFDISFECKLIPKGNGMYLIPITKKIITYLECDKEYEIEMKFINSLSRINHDSPYSKEHPIRRIDGINEMPIQDGLCGQCCVAMLSGVNLDEVINLMGKDHASWSKILESLDYYGLSYAPKAVYTKGKNISLPECCIVNNDNSFILWYKGLYYGVKEVNSVKTISYIEVFVV